MGPSSAARWAFATVAMLVGASGAVAAGQDAELELRITVRVYDKAGVQGAALTYAEARAARVFAMIRVNVDWVDGNEANRLNLVAPYTILIMAEAPPTLKAAMKKLGTDVMGQGAPSVARAYIYYDRVLQLRVVPPRDVTTTLGDVIAHELGHLMLPPGHSNLGIMRPSINMRSRSLETFTEAEAANVRGSVRDRANAARRPPNPEP
jgi:hypothetical protein